MIIKGILELTDLFSISSGGGNTNLKMCKNVQK